MSPPLGLLYNRKMLAGVALFCLIEAVWSWVSVTKGTRQQVNVIVVPFAVCLAFIAASIVYRTSFWEDRLIFGAIAGAFALIAVRTSSSALGAMVVFGVAHAFMWTIAAVVGLIVLALGSTASRQ
jgi:hypothetical protein